MAGIKETLTWIGVFLFAIAFFGNLLTQRGIFRSPRLMNLGPIAGRDTMTSRIPNPSRSSVIPEYDDIPPFVGLPNSSFRSPFHRHWDTNCSLILKQDVGTINATAERLKSARADAGTTLVPPDHLFVGYTQNCPEFKRLRNYPTRPLSEEERDYPIAYIFLIHKEVAQFERLLRAVYQPQNIYCVHPDNSASLMFRKALWSVVSCFDNVFISSKLENVQYGGFTRLKADLNCMGDLLQKPVQWSYVINLCGQDFPLKTNLEIVRQLKAGKKHNFVHTRPITPYKQLRVDYHHETEKKTWPERTEEKKVPPPYNFTIYVGNAYYAVTREFVNYVLLDHRAIALLKWSEDTYSPDEHYWATLQSYPGVPGGFKNAHLMNRDFRFIRWGGDGGKCPPCNGNGMYVRGVCVFGMGYVPHLVKQPLTFANKFYYDYDPVALQCLEEMLDYRQRYPETIHQFVKHFPISELDWTDVDYYCPSLP